MHDDGQHLSLPSELVTLHARMLLALHDQPAIGQEKLSWHLDVASRTVPRYVAALERDGYLSVDRTQKPHRYMVLLDDAEIVALRRLVTREQVPGPQGTARGKPRRVLTCQASSDRHPERFGWLWGVLFPPAEEITL
jgi:hypothetical protein